MKSPNPEALPKMYAALALVARKIARFTTSDGMIEIALSSRERELIDEALTEAEG